MLKDPSHTDLTEYELLQLPFNVPLTEVRDSLKRFMREQGRKSPHLLPSALKAQKKLQNPIERAEIDIWLYDVNLSGEVGESSHPLDLDEFSRPKALVPAELYCDLTGADLNEDKREITLQKMKYSNVREFDNLDSIRFTPKFDR